MTQASKRAACEVDTEDKISSLPGDVIHHILEFVPIKDAARTCILSKRWRYLWAELPNLVLDKHFCSELAIKPHYVDKILLHHIGDIVKFDLDVSGIKFSSDTHIDSWLRYVTRNGVKQLTLKMPNDSAYKIPSYVFSHALTHLNLFNCVIKPPNTSLDFENLITLSLQRVSFLPTSTDLVIKAPFLSKLTLFFCIGTQNLKFVSPNCKNLGVWSLQVDKLNLEKFLCSLPMLEVLTLSSRFTEFLGAVIIPNELPFTLDYLRHQRLLVDFSEVAQVSCVLALIKGSPNLTELEIWVSSGGYGGEAVLSLDGPLHNLKNVVVHWFKGSIMELAFVKLLFAHTPLLMRMSIAEHSSKYEKNVMSSLMQFRRASPKAELFYFPSSN